MSTHVSMDAQAHVFASEGWLELSFITIKVAAIQPIRHEESKDLVRCALSHFAPETSLSPVLINSDMLSHPE